MTHSENSRRTIQRKDEYICIKRSRAYYKPRSEYTAGCFLENNEKENSSGLTEYYDTQINAFRMRWCK